MFEIPKKRNFCWGKISFFPLFRWTKISNYEIFDLLYSNLIEKFDADNVVGKQQIRIHLLKPDEEIDPVVMIDFLN